MIHANFGLFRVVIVVLAFEPGRVAADGERSDNFTADEMRRLAQGELVSRATSERTANDAPMIGGTSWQVIDRRPDDVWSLLLDPSQYPRTLPQVTHAEVVHEAWPERTVFIEHGNGLLHLSYYLAVRIDPGARRISFHVDPSRDNDIRSGTGFYLVRPFGKDKTLLVYAVLADIGDQFFAALMRANVQEWILKVPWLIKRVAERSKPALTPSATPRPPTTTRRASRVLRVSFRASPSCRAASGCG